MDSVIDVVPHRLEISNRTGQGASQKVDIVASHTYLLALITILGFCIPLKFPNRSPYETLYGTRLMNTFIIEMCAYIISLIVMGISAGSENAYSENVLNKICLFLGTLPVILELIVLIKPFGRFISFIWSICFVCFVYKYRQSLLTLWNSSAVGHQVQGFRQILIDWNKPRRIRNDEADNMSISNDAGDIELQPQNLNINNERPATEHQSQKQNQITVTDPAISIPDNS